MNKPGTPPQWSEDVLQAGIDQNVIRDTLNQDNDQYAAWYGWDPGDGSIPTYLSTTEFPVGPGDLVHILVQYLNPTYLGVARFVNYTRKKYIVRPIPKPPKLDRYRGDTVQWVIERPYNPATKTYYEFADYKEIEFSLPGALRSDDVFITPERGDLMTMNGDDPSNTTIISQPSFDPKKPDRFRIDWMGPH